MELDTDKIDEAVLALLYLGLHDGVRVWKAVDRLHEKGFSSDPRGRARLSCSRQKDSHALRNSSKNSSASRPLRVMQLTRRRK